MFKEGDEAAWAEIETSVLEFEDTNKALTYFQNKFLPYLSELQRRCIFIETEEGKKVATATAWWSYTGLRRDPWLHWIAVNPAFQGKGLGKALVNHVVRLLLEIEGDRDAYLHTQTWSYKAVNIYRQAGFQITDKAGIGGHKNDAYQQAMEIISPFLRDKEA
jgi:GNAT superfamily N-acetyltransferase